MAAMILLNDVNVNLGSGALVARAGETYTDPVAQAAIASSGGILWPVTSASRSAAGVAAKLRANGANGVDISRVMMAGVLRTQTGVVLVKSADQSVIGTALTNDNTLAFSMQASDVWIVHYEMWITYTSNVGMQLALTVPTGALLNLMCFGVPIAGTAQNTDAEQTSTSGQGVTILDFGGSGTSAVAKCTATIVGDGVHAGNVQLQFSSAAVGDTVTIKQGSGMRAALQ